MGQGTFQGGAQARALPIERPGCSSGMGPGTSGQCTSVIIWVARQQPAPSSSDCSAARQQHGPQVLHKLRLPGRAEEDAAVSEVWMVHHLPGGGVGQSMGRWSVPRSLGPAAGEASGSGEQCVCGGGGGLNGRLQPLAGGTRARKAGCRGVPVAGPGAGGNPQPGLQALFPPMQPCAMLPHAYAAVHRVSRWAWRLPRRLVRNVSQEKNIGPRVRTCAGCPVSFMCAMTSSEGTRSSRPDSTTRLRRRAPREGA